METLGCKLDQIKSLLSDNDIDKPLSPDELAYQATVVNTRIHTITSDLLQKGTHPQILGNVLFSNWLRLSSTLGNNISESYYQKMEHYFGEIIQAVRDAIPRLFQGTT